MNASSRGGAPWRALMGAGLFLGVTALVKWASPALIDAELAQRLIGFMMGGIVVLYANAVPKQLTPLALLRCDPAAEQALRRFTGKALVLGGLGYSLAWLAAPIVLANALAGAVLAVALVVALGRYFALFSGRPEA
jgi:hypothetical protein